MCCLLTNKGKINEPNKVRSKKFRQCHNEARTTPGSRPPRVVYMPCSAACWPPGTGAGRGGHGVLRGAGARGGGPGRGRPGQGQARPGSAVAGPSRRARGRGPGQAPPGSGLTPGCPGHHGHARASTTVPPHAHRSLGSELWGAGGKQPHPWVRVVCGPARGHGHVWRVLHSGCRPGDAAHGRVLGRGQAGLLLLTFSQCQVMDLWRPSHGTLPGQAGHHAGVSSGRVGLAPECCQRAMATLRQQRGLAGHGCALFGAEAQFLSVCCYLIFSLPQSFDRNTFVLGWWPGLLLAGACPVPQRPVSAPHSLQCLPKRQHSGVILPGTVIL